MRNGLRVVGYGLLVMVLYGADGEPQAEWRAFHETTSIKTAESNLVLKDTSAEISLPPAPELGLSLSSAIKNRRSRRELYDDQIGLNELSALLYYAIGITGGSDGHPLRASPSAGALYPTELIVAAHGVDGLEAGLYRYCPEKHCLVLYKKGNIRSALPGIALNQAHAGRGACAIIISSKIRRTLGKYGQRGYRYAMIDAGAVCQNIYLAAEALGLGTVAVGAFGDDALANLLGLDEDEIPLLIMPVGKCAR